MTHLHSLDRVQCNHLYLQVIKDNDTVALRWLCQNDLFFLMTVALRRQDVNRPWLFERCRELDKDPDGHLDLWSREHYKSTLITYGKSIQDILVNPEITIGIFSHTRPIAKAFLRQIKMELETNTFLQGLFPEILYENPSVQSPSWSLDNGIVVKRKTNPKESTVEAWGLVDGQPISKHFGILVYDDVVTKDSVATPEQNDKTTEAWELSLSLGSDGGRMRGIGTRYAYHDTYLAIMNRGALIPRYRLAVTGDPSWDDKELVERGELALWNREALVNKRKNMGPYTFAAQILQNPLTDRAMGFKVEWLRFRDNEEKPAFWNYYLICDPSGSKKKLAGDFSVMLVVGLGPDQKYYVVDGIRDRINLTERTNWLLRFHKMYHPIGVGYEMYGKDSDIEHIKYVQDQVNHHFDIIELGGSMAKQDRIRRLVPVFEQGRIYWQRNIWFTNTERQAVNLTNEFVTYEYTPFPGCLHDDILDCLARILHPDLKAVFPDEPWRATRNPKQAKAEYALWS